jgi:hypothetical protein
VFEVVGVCGRWFHFFKRLMSFEMQKNFSISTKRKKERKIRVYQQLLVGPNAIFAKDKESEGVSYVNQKKEKGGLEGD